MKDGGRVLGMIPAKGGSTRLLRKNVRELGGKSLLGWAADSARESGVISRLIVSTEDAAIAELARKLGIDVPFIRPEKLAKDPAGVGDVGLHALSELRKAGETYDTLVILLPTCPFRTGEDVRAAYNLFRERNASFLMSVSAFSHTPFAAYKLDGGIVEPFFPDMARKRSQELPKAYRPNGAIHVVDVAAFEKTGNYVSQPLHAYEMPMERSIDIDTEDDFRLAEALLSLRRA